MLCQNCGKNEVNFKYTQIINGVKKEMALCSDCAKEMGLENIDFNMPISFSSFLGDFFNEYGETGFLPNFTKTEQAKCSKCGMTYDDFTNSGKFGCDNCYNTFSEQISPMLKNIHGTSEHIGRNSRLVGNNTKEDTILKIKKDDIVKEKPEKEEKIETLKEELNKAIKEERYEDAAKIRDQINKLK